MKRLIGLALLVVGILVALVGAAETMAQSRRTSSAGPTRREAAKFLDDVAGDIRAGNVDAVLASLHPGVVAAYGENACRNHLANVKDPSVAFEIRGVRGPGVWRWSADGSSFLVASAFEVDARRTMNGGT